MRIVVTFHQDGRQIAAYPAELDNGEDFGAAVSTAIKRFREEHETSVFDVTMRIAKDQ